MVLQGIKWFTRNCRVQWHCRVQGIKGFRVPQITGYCSTMYHVVHPSTLLYFIVTHITPYTLHTPPSTPHHPVVPSYSPQYPTVLQSVSLSILCILCYSLVPPVRPSTLLYSVIPHIFSPVPLTTPSSPSTLWYLPPSPNMHPVPPVPSSSQQYPVVTSSA